MENVEEEHRTCLKVYSQIVQHFSSDHETQKEEILIEREDILKLNHNEYNNRINDLKTRKLNLKEEIKENDVLYATEIKEIEQRHKSDVEIQKTKMNNDMIQLKENFDLELLQLEKEMELNRKISIHDVEERNNVHIFNLQQNQIESKDRLKSYYESILHENQRIVQDLEGGK